MTAETSLGVIRRHLAPLSGKRVLDCGCGGGALAKALAAGGARVTGVDPSEAAVVAARAQAPDAAFEVARAEALPFEHGSFDGVVFLNALHHVPVPVMRIALGEALRVVTPGGRVIVIEPLAEGSYNAVLKIIDDETTVRARAQQVVESLAASGVERLESVRFDRLDLFDDVEAFLARAVAVDPSRRNAVVERRREIAAAFRRHAEDGEDGRYVLKQPHKVDVFVAPSAAQPL